MSDYSEDISKIREQLARYEERFLYSQNRLDSIANAHETLRDSVESIRQKIFNGYDRTMTDMRTDISNVYETVMGLREDYIKHSNEFHMDKNTVREIIKSALSEYMLEYPSASKEEIKEIVAASISAFDSGAMREKREETRWWKHHKLEILAAVGVFGTLASASAAILVALGVL